MRQSAHCTQAINRSRSSLEGMHVLHAWGHVWRLTEVPGGPMLVKEPGLLTSKVFSVFLWVAMIL
jgi:hypothetical protein